MCKLALHFEMHRTSGLDISHKSSVKHFLVTVPLMVKEKSPVTVEIEVVGLSWAAQLHQKP